MKIPTAQIIVLFLLTLAIAIPAYANPNDHNQPDNRRGDQANHAADNHPPHAAAGQRPAATRQEDVQHHTPPPAPRIAVQENHMNHYPPDGHNYNHSTREYWNRSHNEVFFGGPVFVNPAPVVIYNQSQPYVQVQCNNNAVITDTIVGGAVGGLIGNQFGHRGGRVTATVGGTLLGALLGNQMGQADESCAAQALEYGAPNTQVVWQNNGNSYVVQPTSTFVEDGETCREYQTRVIVGGQTQQAYGTACRQPDGSWATVSSD